ncbi:MAG: hypothetical protein QXK73_06060 [Candidatus Bathyarchaeia archaeon]
MLSELEVWFLPNNLRASSKKAAILLKNVNYDALFLNVPREFGWLVDELASGAPYEQFIEKVRQLSVLRESIVSWEYKFKPIFLAIRGLKLKKSDLKIICYRESAFENLSTGIAEEIATLILRVSITGKVDVNEWRSIISKVISGFSILISNECNYILETWIENCRERKTICFLDYPAKRLVKRARELGIRATLRCVLTPYIFTPLEVLLREFIMASERRFYISNARIEKLIRMHTEFIRNYILTSDCYDEAYFRWLRDGHYKQY